MRILAPLLFVVATALAQNLVEYGAVTAGSTIGGASGKKVSDGITAIFGKVDQQTAKAAGTAALKVAPGVPLAETGDVPLPPPQSGKRAQPPSLPVAQITVSQEATRMLTLADVAPKLPPPPEMSPEDFKTVSNGMTRADVLKFGAPNSKITMFEDGHLVEVYSYNQHGQKLGTLRLTDGAVSNVQ